MKNIPAKKLTDIITVSILNVVSHQGLTGEKMSANKAILIIFTALLIFLSSLNCSKKSPSHPANTPTTVPIFAIYNGDPRPTCTCIITRTDLVAPQTVDTTDWGAPQKVSPPVNDNCPDDDAFITADGQTLYFYWSPGINPSSADLLYGTTGVYYAQNTGGPGEFGTPYFLDLRKGTNGACDGHPRLTQAKDKVYFHSTRSENTGYQQPTPVSDTLDVYVATLSGNTASPATNLGTAVNSIYSDGEPGLSPDGNTIYFASNRPGGLGGNDIYYSTWTGVSWTAAVNIGAPINSASNDEQVAFAANDPNTMYFVSDRNGIGMAIYSSIYSGGVWQTPLLVMQGQVGSPSLTSDGKTMYFVHVLTDNNSNPVFGADIYYVIHN